MKIIKEMCEFIDEEIDGVKQYAKMALKLKDEYPVIAETFYDLSVEEGKHMKVIHEAVAKMIEKYRNEHGEPPADMMTLYNYMHEKSIDKYACAKRYQDMYK